MLSVYDYLRLFLLPTPLILLSQESADRSVVAQKTRVYFHVHKMPKISRTK